jgi:hypothetical protein
MPKSSTAVTIAPRGMSWHGDALRNDTLGEPVRNSFVPVMLTSTETLTQRAMLNALIDEAKLHEIDPVFFRNHEAEISAVIQKLIVASRSN